MKALNRLSSDFNKILLKRYSRFLIVFLLLPFEQRLPFIDFSERSVTGSVLIPLKDRCLTLGDKTMCHALICKEMSDSTNNVMCSLSLSKATLKEYSMNTFYSYYFFLSLNSNVSNSK